MEISSCSQRRLPALCRRLRGKLALQAGAVAPCTRSGSGEGAQNEGSEFETIVNVTALRIQRPRDIR